jgi:SnoaL-like polyketide cyclase
VEATAAISDPTLAKPVPPAKLLREPLFWASAAAFVGVVVGLAGTFSSVRTVLVCFRCDGPPFWAFLAGSSGSLLAALSLLGVASLLGRGSWAARVGVALLLLWLAAFFSYGLYFPLWQPELVFPRSGEPPFALRVLGVASLWGGSLATLPFALGSLFEARRRWLGAVLLVLSVPGTELLFFLYNPPEGFSPSEWAAVEAVAGYATFVGSGVGVPEAVLWVSVGVLLGGEALSKVRRRLAEENCEKALRLYEVGLAKNDPSVVVEVVSDEFRDPRRGVSGKGGMERIVADLWASYPDLGVSVENQEAEGDLVRTRLVLSGTDRGQRGDVVPAHGQAGELRGRVRGPLQRGRAGRAHGAGGHRRAPTPTWTPPRGLTEGRASRTSENSSYAHSGE